MMRWATALLWAIVASAIQHSPYLADAGDFGEAEDTGGNYMFEPGLGTQLRSCNRHAMLFDPFEFSCLMSTASQHVPADLLTFSVMCMPSAASRRRGCGIQGPGTRGRAPTLRGP